MEIPNELIGLLKKYVIVGQDEAREIRRNIKRISFTESAVNHVFMPELVAQLLTNEDYRAQILNILNSENEIISLGFIVNGDISLIGKTTKSAFVTAFYRYYKSGELNSVPNIDELVQPIISSANPYNEEGIFAIEIDGKHVEVKREDLIEFILNGRKEINLSKEVALFGLSKDEFFYVLKTYIKQEKIVESYLLPDDAVAFIDEVEKDTYATTDHFNMFRETLDRNLHAFNLTAELRNAVLGNMPQQFNELEKAIYVYIKLAQTLTYDSYVYASDQSREQVTIHAQIERLATITPNNSSVVCFEFTQLYGKLLNEIDINYDIPETEDYGTEHTSLKFRAGKHIVIADSVKSILGGDMFASKVGEKLEGLTSDSLNEETYNEFQETLQRVYAYVIEHEPTQFMQENSFEHFRMLYSQVSALPQITKQEKMEMLTKRCKEINLPDMDKLSYLIKYSKILFMNEYNQQKFDRAVVSKNQNGTRIPLIIFYFSDIPFNENGEMEFLTYDPINDELCTLTKQEMEQKFISKTFEYVGKSERRIPNLNIGGKERWLMN